MYALVRVLILSALADRAKAGFSACPKRVMGLLPGAHLTLKTTTTALTE
jgi:hypothetical protein